MTIEELKTDVYPSQLRNKLIAEAFYLTENIEKYGSGMIRIRQELESYSELNFKIEETGGGILVTFSSHKMRREGVSLLYECIQNNPGLRLPDYSKLLGISVKTLEHRIKNLRQKKKVMFKGSPKNGGYHPL